MKISQISLACIVALVAMFVVGCDSKEDDNTEVDSNSVKPNAATEIQYNNIVVTVNGIDITEKTLKEKIQAEIEKKKVPTPPAFLARYKQELRRKLLDDMIVELLLDEKVKENKIVVSDRDVDTHIRQLNAKNRMSMNDFLEMLDAMGKDLDEYKVNLRKRLGHEKLLKVKLFDSIEISEQEARKYYSENPQEFQGPAEGDFEQVKVDIIQKLYKNKQKELLNEYIEKLKQEANIIYPANE